MHHYRLMFVVFLLMMAGPHSLSHATTLEHKPYLQNATPTSMVIRWRTNTSTNTKLAYGAAPGNLSEVISNPANTSEHEVKITGLTPGSKYYYSVGSSTETLAGGDNSHYFVTSPNPGTVQAVSIWAVGDSGTADENARAVRDAYLADRGNSATDLFLMLGDNAYNDGSDTQYTKAVFDMYPMVMRQTPTWTTFGNHDGRSASSSSQSGPYYDLLTLPANGEAGGLASGTEAYYSFDYANIHFICLNSQDVSRATNDAMLTWLRSDLSNTTQTWIIAFWHHPPYTKGSHDSDDENQLIQMRENALPILEAHGVDLVLSGHSHAYERSYLLNGHYGHSGSLTDSMKISAGDGRVQGDGAYTRTDDKGAVYVVAGSSGKISGGPLNHPAMYISMNRLGSLAIEVQGNRLDARFIDNNGAIKDNFTLTRGTFNQPPVFNSDPINKAVAEQDQAYSRTLANDATDADGDALSFSKISGPAWLTLSSNGDLRGTPDINDVGANSFTVRVSDGAANAEATLNITVNAPSTVNQPPTFNSNPINKAAADQDQAYSRTLANDASDADGDALSFSKISGPAWLTLSSNGDLRGTPANNDVGDNSFTVRVSDGTANAEAKLDITVNVAPNSNQPPSFDSNTISKTDATADLAYSGSIANNASDPDGDSLIFSKTTGPTWLTIASDGELIGTPSMNDSGINDFTVQAFDGQATAQTTLTITVTTDSAGNNIVNTDSSGGSVDHWLLMFLSVTGLIRYRKVQLINPATGKIG